MPRAPKSNPKIRPYRILSFSLHTQLDAELLQWIDSMRHGDLSRFIRENLQNSPSFLKFSGQNEANNSSNKDAFQLSTDQKRTQFSNGITKKTEEKTPCVAQFQNEIEQNISQENKKIEADLSDSNSKSSLDSSEESQEKDLASTKITDEYANYLDQFSSVG